MTFRAIVLFCAVGAFATPALTQTQCSFTTECFETEACAETNFQMQFDVSTCPVTPGPRSITAQTDFGDLQGTELTITCAAADAIHEGGAFALAGDGATYLLSLGRDAARLTTHITGPITATYIGTCEASD